MANNMHQRRGYGMTEKDDQQLEKEIASEQEHSLDNQLEEIDENFHEEQDNLEDDELTSSPTEAIQSKPSNSSTKVWMITSIVLLAALIYALIQPPFNNNSESVATVNGVSISKDKLFDKMIETGGLPILDTMIIEEILDQKAVEQGIKITSSDIDEEIGMFKLNFPTDEEWQAVLAQNGTTEDDLRKDLVIRLQIRELLASKTDVTDEEISNFFDENVDAMTVGDKVPTLEEKKEEIRYTLVNQKVDQLAQAYIEEARASADIKNNLTE